MCTSMRGLKQSYPPQAQCACCSAQPRFLSLDAQQPVLLQGLGFDPETCAIMSHLGLREEFTRLSEPIDTEEHRWNAWDFREQRVKAVSLAVNAEHKHRRCSFVLCSHASHSQTLT